MIGKKKFGQKSFKLFLIIAAVAMLASFGFVMHILNVSETNAYFYNEQKHDVELTVIDDVYGSIFGQIIDSPVSVNESVYKNEFSAD